MVLHEQCWRLNANSILTQLSITLQAKSFLTVFASITVTSIFDTQLIKRKHCLYPWFWRFPPFLFELHTWNPKESQQIMASNIQEAKLLASWHLRTRKREEKMTFFFLKGLPRPLPST